MTDLRNIFGEKEKTYVIGRYVEYTLYRRGDSERFALRLLVINVKGPTSYEALRTVRGRAQPCTTFAEAAKLLGILDDQSVWERTLHEASSFLSPQQMRDLFVQVWHSIFLDPANTPYLDFGFWKPRKCPRFMVAFC